MYYDEVGEWKLVGLELLQKMQNIVAKIRERIKTAQDQQKSYVDNQKKDLKHSVGDKIFQKVTPTKGILRFGKKGKLSPQFSGPFEILERIGDLAYHLALPLNLSKVHNVSMYQC